MDVVDSTEASWVVVDAGNADFSLSWHGIQPEVAKFTRICTYDRAGYGRSDPSPSRARQRRWLMVTEIVQRLYYQYAKVTVKCRIAPSR